MNRNHSFLQGTLGQFLGSNNSHTVKIPLRLALTVPFVAQLILIVSVVGYFSFRNGKAAADVAMQDLEQSTVETIEKHLKTYLDPPQKINATTQYLLRSGGLSLQEPDRLSQYFWRQLEIYKSLRFLYLGTAAGGYIGATREVDATLGPAGSISVDRTPNLVAGQIHTYRTDGEGNAVELVNVIESPYDARQRPWFQEAIVQGHPNWSEVFPSFYDPILGIAAYDPIYDEKNQLVGVLGAEIDLDDLSSFLSQLTVGESGSVFLLEPNGFLIAASSQIPLFTRNAETGELQRLTAHQSQSPLLQQIAQQMFDAADPSQRSQPSAIATNHSAKVFSLQQDGQTYQIYLESLSYAPNLNWWVIVALSETDFLKNRQANVIYTIVLCLAIVVLALCFTLWAARWISRPIMLLNRSAQSIAHKDFSLSVIDTPIRELAELVQVFQDMTVNLDTSIGDLRDRFRAAFESTSVGMALVGMDGYPLEVNTALAQMLGYSPAELLALKLEEMTYPEDWPLDVDLANQLIAGQIPSYSLEKRYYDRQEHIVWGLLNMAMVRDRAQNPVYFVAMVQDITERKHLEAELHASHQELQRLANLDGLTQIANRRCFDHYLEQAWTQMQRTQGNLSLVLLDIDHFKSYNDRYGHPQGDQCLQWVAQVLQTSVQQRSDALVARYGGEEFAIILPHTSPPEAIAVVKKIQKDITAQAFPHEASPIASHITCSFGIGTCKPNAKDTPIDLMDLIHQSDRALYQAKYQGRNCWVMGGSLA